MAEALGAIALFIIIFGGAAYIRQGLEIDSFKAQAIERGYAAYCPNNGEWAWTGECGE